MVRIKDIMRKKVITVKPDIAISAIAKIMSNNKIGSVIVMENERPVGIVTSEDVVAVVARGLNTRKTRAKDLPKKRLIHASPDERILDVTKLMVKHKIKRVPVIDKGRLLGLVTDKEILITAPEMVEILSEKLKARIDRVAKPHSVISGICEECEGYSDFLHNIAGAWVCEDCRNKEAR